MDPGNYSSTFCLYEFAYSESLIKLESSLWEAEAGGSRGQEIVDHPGQQGETPTLLKMQNLAECGDVCL